MNFKDLRAKAKRILREDTGCEGLAYHLTYTGELEEEGFKVEEKANGTAKIVFDFPKDYGFALKTLTDLGINVVALELLY